MDAPVTAANAGQPLHHQGGGAKWGSRCTS
eukprot:SAG31_NODE_15840_length_736_cov_0.536892_1_plen_29_part_01